MYSIRETRSKENKVCVCVCKREKKRAIVNETQTSLPIPAMIALSRQQHQQADVLISTDIPRRESWCNIQSAAGIDRECFKDVRHRWHGLLPSPPITVPSPSEITRRPHFEQEFSFPPALDYDFFFNCLGEGKSVCTHAAAISSYFLFERKLLESLESSFQRYV